MKGGKVNLLLWLTLGAVVLFAFVIGGRRGLTQRRGQIEMQEATTPLQPATQPALEAYGLSPSGSTRGAGSVYAIPPGGPQR